MAKPEVHIKVATTAPELSLWFRTINRSQLPLGTAHGLTKTARDVVAKERAEVGNHLKVRSAWVRKGIRFVRAEKRDFPKSKAIVGSRDAFMAIHVEGGIRRPTKGASRIAIPTRAIKRGARGVSKTKRPRALRSKKFIKVVDRTIRKVGGRKGRSRVGRLRIFYLLRRRVRIKPSWPFDKIAEEEVRRVYPRNFRIAFLSAIKTKR